MVTLNGWTDADSDPVNATYAWYVNGVLDATQTQMTYPAASTLSGDVISVQCTPFDGIDSGTPVTAPSVTINNSGPSISTCDLSTYAPSTSQNITASVTGWSDPDGDPQLVDYTWFINGIEQTSITTNLFPSSLSQKRRHHFCSMHAARPQRNGGPN